MYTFDHITYHNVTHAPENTMADEADDTASAGRERKEKVIHTRVPNSLDDEIRARAQALGMSVSNLVRNVLGHAFGLVEDVISDSAAVARSARGELTSPVPSYGGDASAVVGWQTVVLNLNAVCSQCNAIVPRGSEAALGLTDGPGPRPVLCLPCLEELQRDDHDAAPVPDPEPHPQPAGDDPGPPTG